MRTLLWPLEPQLMNILIKKAGASLTRKTRTVGRRGKTDQ
jgi:hypothetical protein